MSEWQQVPLGEFADVQNGYAFKSQEFSDRGIPVIKIKNVASGKITWDEIRFFSGSTQNLSKFLITKGDILIAMTGSHVTQESSAVGKVARYSSDISSLLNQRVGKVYSKDLGRLDNDFLYYFLIQPVTQYKLGVAASGSANQANISPSQIKGLRIDLPLISEQRETATLLACLDRKIENLRRQNKTLERIAQTLFKHWFVDFEFPNKDGKPYKSSGGAMERSELREIPAGWRIGTLEDVVDIFTGYPFKSDLYSFDSGIRVVRGENVSLGFLRWDMEKRWEHDLESYLDYFLQKDDYVIAMDGSRVGRNRSIILSSDLPLILAQRVARLRVKNPIFAGYINTFLNQDRFERYVDFIKTGTSIPHISSTQIKNFECFIPTQDVVSAFEKFYQSWVKKVSLHLGQIQTLTKTRDVLLPQLMSGKLRLTE